MMLDGASVVCENFVGYLMLNAELWQLGYGNLHDGYGTGCWVHLRHGRYSVLSNP